MASPGSISTISGAVTSILRYEELARGEAWGEFFFSSRERMRFFVVARSVVVALRRFEREKKKTRARFPLSFLSLSFSLSLSLSHPPRRPRGAATSMGRGQVAARRVGEEKEGARERLLSLSSLRKKNDNEQ